MAESLPTTETSTTTEWGLGTSGPGIRPGFSQASSNIPAASKLWKNYYDNVMRGDTDGPWYDGSYSTSVDYSKTYSSPSSLGVTPPIITPTNIGGTTPIGEAGAPLGGMGPTIASPGEGNELNAAMLPAMPTGNPSRYGGDGDNGSIQDPKAGSESQQVCVDGSTRSPIYFAGYSGYSNPSGT